MKSHSIIEWATASRPLPGETKSGDQYLVELFPHGGLAAVADGLGHGDAASIAALKAVNILRTHATESIVSLFVRCHTALLETRGIALSLVLFDTSTNTISWLGVGNVEGVLLHDQLDNHSHHGILLYGGVVGYQLPPLQAATLPVVSGDLVILTTDGIRNGFIRELKMNLPVQTIADQILAQYGQLTDDTLVLVIRYWGIAQ